MIYLLTLAFGVANSIILLDEPSVNLHPNLMKSLFRSLQDSNHTNQFLIIIHSPELTSYEIFEKQSNILYLRETNHFTTVKKLNNKTKKWFNKNHPKLKHQLDIQIFFAKSIILTEGDSDKNLLIGISNFFESVSDADLNRNDVIIAQVGGKKSFHNYMKLVEGFGIPYLIISDSDAKDEFDSCDPISKNGINSDGHIFFIENGTLESLMKKIDTDAYSKACKEYGPSKPVVAYSFAEKIGSDKIKSKPFLDILFKAVMLAK